VSLRLVLGGIMAAAVLAAVTAAPATAAPTRAEYIAQADPICQSTDDAERRAIKGYRGLLKKGRYKAAAHKLRAEFAAFSPGVEQIAALEAPAADVQLIATWVQMLRQQPPLGRRVAALVAHGQTSGKLFKRLGALNASTQAVVAGFGFQVCQDF
jgi:hypothetical protein